MFERDHHNRIQTLLSALDTDFLTENKCYFGGGTAIVLALNEYRESVDIDFLCASQEGYRALRNTIHEGSLGAIFSRPVELVRDVRADRYGIRTFLRVDGVPVKFEIVSEGRIEIEGEMDHVTGVPTLTRTDMYAEKLLANADRYRDKAVASRDIIDLAMMIGHWGDVPAVAWDKVRQAYGASADRAFQGAIEMVSDRVYLSQSLAKMHMAQDLVDQIPAVLRGQASSAPTPRPRVENAASGITAAARGVRVVYSRAFAAQAAPEQPVDGSDVERPAG